MIRLIAYSPADGWAYARIDNALFLVRPPYSKERLIHAQKEEVSVAIHSHGFQSEEQPFDSWNELVTFLQRQVSVVRGDELSPGAQEKALQTLLDHAPQEVLASYLDRIEEWVAKGELTKALEALQKLAFSDSLAKCHDLRLRSKALFMDANSRLREQSLDALDSQDGRSLSSVPPWQSVWKSPTVGNVLVITCLAIVLVVAFALISPRLQIAYAIRSLPRPPMETVRAAAANVRVYVSTYPEFMRKDDTEPHLTYIGGRIDGLPAGGLPEHAIIVYTFAPNRGRTTGSWYVQPFSDNCQTRIKPDHTWGAQVHSGTDYAVHLVKLSAIVRGESNMKGQGCAFEAKRETVPLAGPNVLTWEYVRGSGPDLIKVVCFVVLAVLGLLVSLWPWMRKWRLLL